MDKKYLREERPKKHLRVERAGLGEGLDVKGEEIGDRKVWAGPSHSQ